MTLETASHAARTSDLIVLERERGVLSVSGNDRASWLNGVVTCDVLAAKAGVAAFGVLLSKLGKIQTDFYVLTSEQVLLLALAPGTLDLVASDLDRMLVMEDAELGRPPQALATLALHGPRARELAQGAAKLAGAVWGELDRTGLGGAVLLVPVGSVDAAIDSLVSGGAELASGEDWLALRIERRVGLFGTDYGASDNPHEAALDRSAVSWSKGCYLGQEVVFMQDARGKLKRRLALLGVEGGLPAPGVTVHAPSGEPIGEVTSSSQSAARGGPVVLARLKAPHFEPGARLVVNGEPAVVRRDPV